MIDMETENRADTGGVPPVRIVAGNKCDLKESRKVSSREGLEWARTRGCGFMETSARECVNIEETFAREYRSSRCTRCMITHASLFMDGLFFRQSLGPPNVLLLTFEINIAGNLDEVEPCR